MKQNGVEHDFEYWGMEIPIYALGQMKLKSGDRAYIGVGLLTHLCTGAILA
jgi:hypothetical protein